MSWQIKIRRFYKEATIENLMDRIRNSALGATEEFPEQVFAVLWWGKQGAGEMYLGFFKSLKQAKKWLVEQSLTTSVKNVRYCEHDQVWKVTGLVIGAHEGALAASQRLLIVKTSSEQIRAWIEKQF